jgi:hypothetical protein
MGASPYHKSGLDSNHLPELSDGRERPQPLIVKETL